VASVIYLSYIFLRLKISGNFGRVAPVAGIRQRGAFPSEEERPTDFVVKIQYRKSVCWRQSMMAVNKDAGMCRWCGMSAEFFVDTESGAG
jgi:hypothetical protein